MLSCTSSSMQVLLNVTLHFWASTVSVESFRSNTSAFSKTKLGFHVMLSTDTTEVVTSSLPPRRLMTTCCPSSESSMLFTSLTGILTRCWLSSSVPLTTMVYWRSDCGSGT